MLTGENATKNLWGVSSSWKEDFDLQASQFRGGRNLHHQRSVKSLPNVHVMRSLVPPNIGD